MHYLALMVDRRVDGLIVASSLLSGRSWEWLTRSPVPVVVVNAEPSGARVPVITSDNVAGSRLAVEHLAGLGHRRIGYIRGPEAYTAATPRLEGFRLACTAAGLDANGTPIVAGEGDTESGERAASVMLSERSGISAIACYNDLTAIGAFRAIRAAGLRVPDDISVIGFDDIAPASWVVPALTTVAQQKAEMGHLAVAMLARALDGPTGGHDEVVRLSPYLVVRESTGPPSTPASSGR
jgi:DNA-binding LacI/PurR family transcriptional regulator